VAGLLAACISPEQLLSRDSNHAETTAMNVDLLLFPAAEELDVVGPWEMFTLWQLLAAGPERCLLVAETAAPVRCAKGMTVVPHESFASCPPLDVLLVPGGQGTRTEVANPLLIAFVQQQARHCRAVLSVCTGAFILHAAGLLQGKQATTHWGSLDRLRQLADVSVAEDRYTVAGPIWCAAGVSAGIDMTLAFIAATAGEETAGAVQLAAEYFPAPRIYGACNTHPQAPGYSRPGPTS
jgi:transcriptional regulator GlxA family with amidase domain